MDTRKKEGSWVQEYRHNWVQRSPLGGGDRLAEIPLVKAKSMLEKMAANEEEPEQGDRKWVES